MTLMSRRRAIESALVVIALIFAIVPVPEPLVERWFSIGVYPRLQHVMTPLANLVPFAWFDVLLLVVVVLVVRVIVRAVRQARRDRRWSPILFGAWTLVVTGAGIYLAFLGFWGLNYRRVAMTERIEMVPGPPRSDAVGQLGLTAVERLNALYDSAHTQGWSHDEWRDPDFIRAFGEAQRLIQDTPTPVPGRLKQTVLGPYFRWTGIDGMVDPLMLEVLVNPDLLPWERPFVAAHEWSHLAGFADESEASFVGWLTCIRSHPAAQYSGWLFVYWEVIADLRADDRAVLNGTLEAGPRRDLNAIAERLRRGQFPLLRTASWAVYDQYLRANRVESGVQSYGEVVTLILRTRFEDGYRPVRAPKAPSR